MSRSLAAVLLLVCACGSGALSSPPPGGDPDAGTPPAGGGSDAGTPVGPSSPSIASFISSQTSITAGGAVDLIGTFTNGTGAVDNGVGAVRSGIAATVRPAATTTYTLTVSSGTQSAHASVTVTVTPAGTAACIGKPLLDALGKQRILAGASMSDTTAGAAAWDARYIYLAGGIFDSATPCGSCATSCTAAGRSCANSVGCGWWGCFQWDQIAPGDYVRSFVANAKGRGEVPWFTYYELLQASGATTVAGEVASVNNTAFLTRYLNDFRFLLQQIGTDTAFVHVEPDFWGFAQLQNPNAHALPAKVAEANPADCPTREDSVAGLGQCMIAMARKYAPNVKIGLHGSPFATGVDVSINTSASLDIAAEARKLAGFLQAAGAGGSDFVAVDASDRDAAWYQAQGQGTTHFWDTTNASLPSFHQAFTWAGALAEALGVPIAYWQVPVGNPAQNNTNNHWKDNRVDYFFAHPAELAGAHVAAMLFGAGDGNQTTPESDGGNLLTKANAYLTAGGQPLCP